MSDDQYIVVVGTVPGTGRGSYAEFSGSETWGPFTAAEAADFEHAVKDTWESVSEEHFVYGTPFTETRLLNPRLGTTYRTLAEQAARNWHLDPADV